MIAPSEALLRTVRSGFIQQGKSLAKWCAEQKVCRQYAAAVILGLGDGPAARKLRATVAAAAGVVDQAEAG